jgi:hypothetical protein
MRVFDSSRIYGIRIYDYKDGDFRWNMLFEKTYNEIMTDEEKKKVYLFYTELSKNNKIYFQYYSECILIYGTEDINTYGELSKTWYPMSLNLFLEKFGS